MNTKPFIVLDDYLNPKGANSTVSDSDFDTDTDTDYDSNN